MKTNVRYNNKRKYLLLAKDVENKQKMLKSLSVSLLSFPKIGSLAHTPMEVSNVFELDSSIWMALIFVAEIYIRRNIQIVGLRLVKPKNIFVDLYAIKSRMVRRYTTTLNLNSYQKSAKVL